MIGKEEALPAMEREAAAAAAMGRKEDGDDDRSGDQPVRCDTSSTRQRHVFADRPMKC